MLTVRDINEACGSSLSQLLKVNFNGEEMAVTEITATATKVVFGTASAIPMEKSKPATTKPTTGKLPLIKKTPPTHKE